MTFEEINLKGAETFQAVSTSVVGIDNLDSHVSASEAEDVCTEA